jgi:hypothetical protein
MSAFKQLDLLPPAAPRESDSIYCISLWQPWAQWVALGWKTTETRLHSKFASLAGKRIAIHAALKWDKGAIEAARKYLSPEQIKRTGELHNLGGNLICTAHVDSVGPCYEEDSHAALIDCGKVERVGLFLSDIKTFPAVPMRGQQGMWSVHRSLLPNL